jgi:GWxTD domain-containing protein
MILAIAGLLVGSLAGPSTESLQDDPRFGICSIADSVAAEGDTARLRTLLDTAATLDAHQNPQAYVEAGLAAFSLGRFYEDRDLLRQALDRLNDVERTYLEDACYLYWRGAVRRELGTRPPFVAEVWARLRGRDHRELAMADFRDAADLRPDWLAPAAEMAEISLAPFEGRAGRRDRWREWALSALDRYRAVSGPDPEVDLWRSRLLLEAGSFDEAHAAARRLVNSTPSSLADLELARALFALDRADEATEAYWRAVAGLGDGRVLAEMERDLRLIFDRQESTEWAEPMTGAERADWVRRFWARRAARDLVSETDRLAEHYARLRYVRDNYRRISEAQDRLATDRFNRPSDEVLDDRGLIHLRLGEPDENVVCLTRGRNTVYSWIYEGEDGRPLALHLSPARSADDWSFSSLLPDGCYARLGSVHPYYNTLWFKFTRSRGLERLQLATAERDRNEAAVRLALTRDRHRLPLDGRLEFGYEWLFFRGTEPGTVETTVSYGIPIRHLECENSEGSQACRIEVRASIFDRDTVVARGAELGQLEPLSRRTWIVGHFRLSAAPGSWNYRVAAFEPATGGSDKVRGNWGAGRFRVPELWGANDSTPVSISSLVLARPGDGDWVRGEEGLALNPSHIYQPGATVELYYEIYGLPADATYTTEIILVKSDDLPTQTLDPPKGWVNELVEKQGSALRLRFEEVGTRDRRPWIERRKTLTLSGIGEGRYVLILAISPYDEDVTVYRVTPLRVDRDAG